MQELIYVREKISKRIKSMGSDKEGIYAKRMMRRCVKDIDAVIDANKVMANIATIDYHKESHNIEGEMYSLEDFPLMRELFDEPPKKNDTKPKISMLLVKAILNAIKDEKRCEKLSALESLLKENIISADCFLERIVDGSI